RQWFSGAAGGQLRADGGRTASSIERVWGLGRVLHAIPLIPQPTQAGRRGDHKGYVPLILRERGAIMKSKSALWAHTQVRPYWADVQGCFAWANILIRPTE